jgi:hypothetical protein
LGDLRRTGARDDGLNQVLDVRVKESGSEIHGIAELP